MKKLALAVAVALLNSSPLWAQKAGDFGAGVILGRPSGGSAKYWLSNIHAVDAGIGVGSDLVFHADFLWHGWKAFPQPKEGKLALHLGLGARIEAEDHETDFGIRTMAGVDYWLKGHPVELFAEIGPVFKLNNDNRFSFDGGVGVRYYFPAFN